MHCQLLDNYLIFSLSKITSTKFYVEVATSANSFIEVTTSARIFCRSYNFDKICRRSCNFGKNVAEVATSANRVTSARHIYTKERENVSSLSRTDRVITEVRFS